MRNSLFSSSSSKADRTNQELIEFLMPRKKSGINDLKKRAR